MKKSKFAVLYFILSFIWIDGSNFLIQVFVHSSLSFYLYRIKEILYVITSVVLFYSFMKKSEELHSSNEIRNRLSTLINSMVDFVIFKDGEGRWIEANDFCLKLFQIKNIDYRGKKDSELAKYTNLYKDTLRNCEVSDEVAWKNRKITHIEEILLMPNGSEKTFDTLKVPLFHEDGTRKGLVIIGRDITAIRETEEQLRRTEKLSIVGELSASVAHEIRNPLTSLIGFVQLLQSEDKKHESYYQIMMDELKRINDIVGELLLLAKPQHLMFQKANIYKILKDVISLLNTEATFYNIQILFHSSERELSIDCEPNQLKQLFINLIKNAIEASLSGNIVEIWLHKLNHEFISIKIKDFGIGITKERLEKIGEPFYSSKEKGTGLGLTVSFKIIESHHGTIQIESEKHKGTLVTISLPIKKEQ